MPKDAEKRELYNVIDDPNERNNLVSFFDVIKQVKTVTVRSLKSYCQAKPMSVPN